jgi:hypothetical protein
MFQAPLGKNKPTYDTAEKGYNFPLYQFFQESLRKVARYMAVPAQGTLSIVLQPSNNEQFTIGGKTYTFQSALTNVDGNILIGASLAATQQNVIDAINLTGLIGSQYAASMSEHSQVSAALAWVANTLVITAKNGGVSGNSIATTETMVGAGNQFDAATLGTTRAGVDESDADSFLWSSHFNTRDQGGGSSWVIIDPIPNINRWFRNLDDYSQDYGAGFMNSAYAYSGELVAPGASRKTTAPNHFNRRYVNLKTILPRIYTQKNVRAIIPSPYAVSGSNSIIRAIPLDTSRVAYLYSQAAGTTGTYLVIATVDANGAMTFGTPVLVDTSQNNNLFDMCLVNTDKILILFANSAATAFAATRTASISGNVIVMNALVQVAATALTGASICKVGTDKAVIGWQNGSQVTYNVVTLTGTVPSYGAAANITGSPIYTNLVANGTDKAQAFYQKSSNAYTVVVSVSGTSISFGVELVMMLGSFMDDRLRHVALQVATDKFIWFGSTMDENQNADRRNAAFITVTGTASAVSSYAKSGLQGVDHMRLFTVTAGSEYYFMHGNSTSLRGKQVLVDTTLNTITMPYGNPEQEHTQNNDYATSGFWGSNFRDWWDNIGIGGQCVFVQVGTKTIVMGLYTNSFFHYWSTDNVSIGVYNQENLIATLDCKWGFLVRPHHLNCPINEVSACLRYKNNSAVPIYLVNKHTWFEME